MRNVTMLLSCARHHVVACGTIWLSAVKFFFRKTRLHAQYVFISFPSGAERIDRLCRALSGQSASASLTACRQCACVLSTPLSGLSIRQRSRIAVHSGGGASPSFRRSSAWRTRVGVGGGPGRPCAVATKCSAGATDLPSAKTGSLSAADGCDVAAAGVSGLRTKDPLLGYSR